MQQQHSGLVRGSFGIAPTRERCRLRTTRALAAAVGLFAAHTAFAGTIYVFNTSGTSAVPAPYLSQLFATYGSSGDTIVTINAGASNSTLNGTTVHYSSDASGSDIARFFVRGDLNVGAGDRVIG